MEIIMKRSYNCWVSNMASLAHYYCRPHAAIFVNNLAIDMGFLCSTQSFNADEVGNSLSLYMMRRAHGVEISQFRSGRIPYDDICRPLLVNVDAFCLPWTSCYNTTHLPTHCIIIYGRSGSEYMCIDPFFSKENRLIIDLECIGNVNYSETNICCPYDKYEARLDILRFMRICLLDHLNELESMIPELFVSRLTSALRGESNAYVNRGVIWLTELINKRYCYLELMEYMGIDVGVQISMLVKQWEKCKHLSIAYIIKCFDDWSLVSEKIMKCVALEKIVASHIHTYLEREASL